MDVGPDEEATALVGDLVQAARVPAKRRPFAVKPTVERLTSLAYEHGLWPEALRTLVVDVLASPGSHLDQASLASLVRNLYPVGGLGGSATVSASASATGTVPEDVVLAIIGSLGQGQLKPSLAIQSLLLRWLVLVYHILSPSALTALSRAYAVLFNLLDTAGIRPQLCHVLVLITRRKHVRPFRIQAILHLSRQAGHEPHLVGLLRVFKNYYPEVIVGEATRGRASPFKHPDLQWRAHLDEIRQARQQSRRDEANADASAGGVLDSSAYNGFRVRQAIGRRGKGSAAIPTVHTIHAQEESVTLEEIDSAAALVKNLETIELPNQLVAVLADPLLQKLLLLRPSSEAFARAENWLTACVSSAAKGDESGEELMDLVEVVHDYVLCTNTFPPAFTLFFGEILRRWDGKTKKELVLEALAYAPAPTFQDAYASTYAPLEAKLLDNTAESQLSLLSFYTLVLRRWTALLATKEKDQAADEAASVLALVQHVNGLVLALLQADGSASTLSALAVVEFYEQVAAVVSLRHESLLACVQDLIPAPAAVYLLHFGASVAVASRLYGVLADYKKAMEAAMSRRPSRSSAGATQTILSNVDSPLGHPLRDDERARINQFNGYLMDVCNCLWRSRAFSSKDTNALGCRMDGGVVDALAGYIHGVTDQELPLTSAFNLTHAPTLCLQAITYLRQLEDAAMEAAAAAAMVTGDGDGNGNGDGPTSSASPAIQRRHAGPVTQAALVRLGNSGGLSITWQAYRSGLLVHLEQAGLGGIAQLMYNTMKNLMSSRTA